MCTSIGAKIYQAAATTDQRCIHWKHATTTTGVPVVKFQGKTYSAPRVTLALHTKEPLDIPLMAVRQCDSVDCINPHHYKWSDKRPLRNRRPEHDKRNKLTEKQVREILASDEKQVYLAHVYGVAEGTISQIKNRRIWRHVEV